MSVEPAELQQRDWQAAETGDILGTYAAIDPMAAKRCPGPFRPLSTG